MIIATWNLERGGRTAAAAPAQEKTLRELRADVVVLTEPPASFRGREGIVTSPRRRDGRRGNESWVAIVGAGVEPVAFEIPYERMAVAARVRRCGLNVVVYGSVLPWLSVIRHAPYVCRPGESSFDVFARLLQEQRDDVKALGRECDLVLWAGDFNQTLEGPANGGSDARRCLLRDVLNSMGYAAWNASAAHAIRGLCVVDLICGPSDRTAPKQGRIDPVREGTVMSDHAGYWVEIDA